MPTNVLANTSGRIGKPLEVGLHNLSSKLFYADKLLKNSKVSILTLIAKPQHERTRAREEQRLQLTTLAV